MSKLVLCIVLDTIAASAYREATIMLYLNLHHLIQSATQLPQTAILRREVSFGFSKKIAQLPY
ncbi:hypothetical protein GDO86_006998 [Hymenochirus boettgeri]|uniref:Secreted protein n=1 Tax=Hymenochirus boettgeri TaxID=247094 RepID=A0A8T2J8E0_9PIPI|nr:hypothetical protein GDO86_006998 [Hymenochirus boettgeri]